MTTRNQGIYTRVSQGAAKMMTTRFSTSFSLGIRMLHGSIRQDIYNIYGFVRVADEIVDSWYDYTPDRELDRFSEDTYRALDLGYSPNPILHAFSGTVSRYDIDREHIAAFLHSMSMDLSKKDHECDSYSEYIYGSAEVVGLMCLQVFCDGDKSEYNKLVHPARALGSAFQKVNFLRDIHNDQQELGRFYFPGWSGDNLTQEELNLIVAEIDAEFNEALLGIKNLSMKSRFGVYAAYVYYRSLLRKIKRERPEVLMQQRIRIPNWQKITLLAWARLRYGLRRI